MRGWERTGLEEAIAELAERQHGKISRRQLRDLGLGDNAIDYRLVKGWLRPDHRGVYSLGHRPQAREGRWMAAVLHGGEGDRRSVSHGWAVVRMTNTDAVDDVKALLDATGARSRRRRARAA